MEVRMMNKPHMPTLGCSVVIIVAVVLLYHFTLRKR
jgi:hypothetical protein